VRRWRAVAHLQSKRRKDAATNKGRRASAKV